LSSYPVEQETKCDMTQTRYVMKTVYQNFRFFYIENLDHCRISNRKYNCGRFCTCTVIKTRKSNRWRFCPFI